MKNFLLYGVNLALSAALIFALEQINMPIQSYGDFIKYGFLTAVPVLALFIAINCLLFKKDISFVASRIKNMLVSKFRRSA